MAVPDKIKILMVGPAPPQIGGMESMVSDLLNSGLKNSYRIIHLNTSKPAIKRKPVFKAPVGYAAAFKRNLLVTLVSYGYSSLFLFKFLALLMIHRIRIVHLHTIGYTSFWEKCLYIVVARLTGISVVMHVHAPQFEEFYYGANTLIRWLIRTFFEMCDAVIVLSESWKEFFAKIIDEKLLFVVPNGISLADYRPLTRFKEPSVLFLAEVSQRKGVYDLLRAIVATQAHGIAIRYYIVGPGEIDLAKDLAEKLEISGRVVFLGPKTGREKSAILGQCWLFVLPSYAEGLPVCLIEAMAAGLPVISTTVGGIPELITDGENGFLIRPGDVEGLTDNIIRLVHDRKLRECLSKNNVLKAAEKYGIEKCAQKVDFIYKSLIN